jgi:hypothetical protein
MIALAVLCLTPRAAVAEASDDAAMALTGASTAETEGLDKEIAKLLQQYDDVQVKLQAARQAKPINAQTITQLYKQGPDLMKQALALADQAADKRAHEAVQQRCLAPAKQSASAADSAASSYLCGAVLAGPAKSGGNDPWAVCSCVHQYLVGAKQELEQIDDRAKEFVGKVAFDRFGGFPHAVSWATHGPNLAGGDIDAVFPHTISAAEVNQAFQTDRPIDTEAVVSAPSRGFEWAAKRAQRLISEWRVMSHDPGHKSETGRPFLSKADREIARLYPPTRYAYQLLQEAARRLWSAHQLEAVFQLTILQESVAERQKQAYDAFKTEDNALWDRHEAMPHAGGWMLDPNWRAQSEQACERSDAAERPFIEATVPQVRATVTAVKDARRRLMHDFDAWKRFAVADGAGAPAEPAGFNYGDADFAQFNEQTFVRSPGSFASYEFFIPPARYIPHGAAVETAWYNPFTPAKCINWAYYVADAEARLPRPIAPVAYDENGKPGYGVPPDLRGQAQQGETWAEDKALIDGFDDRLRQALQQRLPEVSSVGAAIALSYPMTKPDELAEAIVSGAGPTERP